MKLIDKEKLIALLETKMIQYRKELNTITKDSDNAKELATRVRMCFEIILEIDKIDSVWHKINETPKYNLNGVSDFIISSAYGHIEREAHTYTPEQWSAHIGFNENREFEWAYEKDLI